MSACQLRIELDEAEKVYQGGDHVRGTVVAIVEKDSTCKGLVVTSGWSTHGRGNVDRAELDSVTVFSGSWLAGQEYRYPFELRSASWPPTYYGTHLNVSHGVTAKAKLAWAFDPSARAEYAVIATSSPEDLAPERNAKPSSLAWVGWTVLALFVVFIGWMLLFLVPVLLVVGALVWFFKSYLPKSLTGEVTCNVEPLRLRPGEVIRGKIAFTPKRKTQLNGVVLTVSADEVCVSGSGSNATTHTHHLHSHMEQLLEPGPVLPGQLLEFPFEYSLPMHASPSLALKDNKLNWEVKLRIDIPKWPDWTKTYALIVDPLPEVPQVNIATVHAERGWLGQVVDQLSASKSAPDRQALVLQAVREHVFDVQLDIEEELPEGVISHSESGGTWCEGCESNLNVCFFVFFPDGLEHPPEGSTWTGRIQITGFEEEVIAKAVL
jgi:hypothetical protein